MPTTPKYLLPYPNESDPADVPVDMQKLALKLDDQLDLWLPKSALGVANGVASLDSGGKVPSSQLPAAAPSGATVATTVAGLGAGAAGKQGLLRLGASPYELLALTYDATYGKWVSEQRHWTAVSASPNSSGPGAILQQVNAGTCVGYGPKIPWALYAAAGLSLQLRVLAIAVNQSGGAAQASLTPKHQGLSANGALGAGTALGSGFSTNSTSAILIGDVAETTWRTASATVGTFCVPTLELVTTTSPGNTNSYVYEWSVFWRYVA